VSASSSPTSEARSFLARLRREDWTRFGRLLCAAGVGVCATAAASGQTAEPTSLSGALRDHVRDERFDLVSSVRGLPLGVRERLQELFGSPTLDIAEPGAEFQGERADEKTRRLVAAGCSVDHCLVYYERGGSAHTWLVALFHWTPAATRLELGGQARGGLTNIEAVRGAVLTGEIKGPVEDW
jgi:hypothetical protein